MGYMTQLAFKEYCGKLEGLKMHLEGNFYPPHPKYVVDSTIKGFQKYWNYEIDIEELAHKYCYLKDTNGLNDYYICFINEEDLEE